MAWLALATYRLDTLAEEARQRTARATPASAGPCMLQFEAACTDDLNGGAFWSKKRDFKNTRPRRP